MRIYLLPALLALVVFLAGSEIGLDPVIALPAAGMLGLLALTLRSEAPARASRGRSRTREPGSADQGPSRDTR